MPTDDKYAICQMLHIGIIKYFINLHSYNAEIGAQKFPWSLSSYPWARARFQKLNRAFFFTN